MWQNFYPRKERVVYGQIKSCGCKTQKDLLHKQFGNWLVIEKSDTYYTNGGNSKTMWLCECQCQNKTKKILSTQVLLNGECMSCGCLRKNNYDLTGEYGVGYTLKGEPFYFDLEDYNLINKYTWHYDKDKYLTSNINNTSIKMHRLIMNVLNDNKLDVDHIRHINYDNRKSELRIVTHQQNSFNRNKPKNNTSGVMGVWYDKNREKFETYITIDRNKIHLGRFENFEDAVNARKEAEEKYFGEYSYDNSVSLTENNRIAVEN